MTHDEIKNLLFEKLNEIIPKDRREGIGIIIGTFDDLIYGDYRYILQYFISTCYDSNTKSIDSEKFVNLLTSCNRLDLLQYITAYDENGNKIKGTGLNKI